MTRVTQSLRQPSFWKVAAATFALAALYPVVLTWQCGWAQAARWAKNDIAFTVFVLWIFPLITGLLATSLLPGVWHYSTPAIRRALLPVGGLLVIASVIVVHGDISRVDNDDLIVPPEPVVVRGTQAVLLDDELRKPLRDAYREVLERVRYLKEDEQALAWKEYEDLRKAHVAKYRAAVPGFSGIRDAAQRSSITAVVKLILNVMVAVTIALVFLCLTAAVAILYTQTRSRLNAEALLVTYSLGCLWFPMRLYTEWYIGFYSFALDSYLAFWILAFVALIGLPLLVYVLKPGNVAVTIPSMAAAVGVIFSGIAWFKPHVLWYLGNIVEKLNLALLFVAAVVLVTPLAAIAFAAATKQPTYTPQQP